jgi:excisionase family DNA binding protein
MNKEEAAKYLQIGVRSLERHTSAGRVAVVRLRGKTGLTLDYEEAELERFKTELDAPVSVGVVVPEIPLMSDSPSVAATPANTQSTLARLPKSETRMVSMRPKEERLAVPVADLLLLKLEECQALTGLSRAVLRSAIDAGALKAQQIGRAWRIKRSDLDAWIEAL